MSYLVLLGAQVRSLSFPDELTQVIVRCSFVALNEPFAFVDPDPVTVGPSSVRSQLTQTCPSWTQLPSSQLTQMGAPVQTPGVGCPGSYLPRPSARTHAHARTHYTALYRAVPSRSQVPRWFVQFQFPVRSGALPRCVPTFTQLVRSAFCTQLGAVTQPFPGSRSQFPVPRPRCVPRRSQVQVRS